MTLGTTLENASDVAIGKHIQQAHIGDNSGTFFQTNGSVTFGENQRDSQYIAVVNWDREERFRNFDLSGRDLARLDLSRADLRGANLEGANFESADLSQTDFSGANLKNCNLKEANLWGAVLVGANLENATLVQAKLEFAQLVGANLKGANIETKIDYFVGRWGDNENSNWGAHLDRAIYDKKTKWEDGFDPVAAGAILVEE